MTRISSDTDPSVDEVSCGWSVVRSVVSSVGGVVFTVSSAVSGVSLGAVEVDVSSGGGAVVRSVVSAAASSVVSFAYESTYGVSPCSTGGLGACASHGYVVGTSHVGRFGSASVCGCPAVASSGFVVAPSVASSVALRVSGPLSSGVTVVVSYSLLRVGDSSVVVSVSCEFVRMYAWDIEYGAWSSVVLWGQDSS